jgi:hypothetical protein
VRAGRIVAADPGCRKLISRGACDKNMVTVFEPRPKRRAHHRHHLVYHLAGGL